MHFILSVLAAIFIVMLIIAILTLGSVMIAGLIGAAVIIYLALQARRTLRRWRFLYHGRARYVTPPTPQKAKSDEENITDVDWQ